MQKVGGPCCDAFWSMRTRFRDGMVELLATLLKDQALDGFADPFSAMWSPAAQSYRLEVLLAGWWTADEQRTRLLSAVLIDIDRMGRINPAFWHTRRRSRASQRSAGSSMIDR